MNSVPLRAPPGCRRESLSNPGVSPARHADSALRGHRDGLYQHRQTLGGRLPATTLAGRCRLSFSIAGSCASGDCSPAFCASCGVVCRLTARAFPSLERCVVVLFQRCKGSNSCRRGVGGRYAGAFGGTDSSLQWLWRARWRDRTRQEALADWAGASLRGRWVGWRVSGGRAPSGWEWNGSQPGQGAAELLLPGPAPGKMQGQSACRAGEPSG